MFGLLRSKKEKHAEEANMQTKQNVRSGDEGNAPKRHHGGPVAQHMKAQALVINCGSSSLKYGVFEIHSETDATLLASGLVEKIGLDMGAIKHEVEGKDKQVIEMPIPTHDVGLEKVVELLLDGVIADKSDVKVVGHRVVHGGDKFTAAALLDAEAKAAIQEAAALAPLHNPANLMGIEVCEKLFPVPQVAVFDTAFHMTMGPEAYLYALPIDLYKKDKIRRYGFHGTSYTYVTQATAEALGKSPADLNLIVCHLGNGSSMACISGGKCLDTTMGMTPLEGLCMGTRSGDVDGGIYTHLTQAKKMTPKDVDTLLNKKSGLAGLCGTPDMRAVIAGAEGGSEDHQNALGVFVHRVRKYLGSFLVHLGGKCDAVVFTGGIGENAKLVREMVCKDLAPLGIELDEGKNNSTRGGLSQLQTAVSRTKIMVVPTNEELSIALQSTRVAGVAPAPKPVAAVVEASDSMMEVDVRSLRRIPIGDDIFDVEAKKTNAVYIEPISTKSSQIFEIGIMTQALQKVQKIGYFRPFARGGVADDRIALVKDLYGLEEGNESMYGVSVEDAMTLLTNGKEDELLDTIMAKYGEYSKGKEFVLVSGTTLPAESHDWNTMVCATLNVPMIMVDDFDAEEYTIHCSTQNDHASDIDGAAERVYNRLMMSKQELDNMDGHDVELAGVFINKLPRGEYGSVLYDAARSSLVSRFGDAHVKVLCTVPYDRTVASLELAQIQAETKAAVLYGGDLVEGRLASSLIVGVNSMPDLLGNWKDVHAPLVMLYASQGEVLLSTLLAAISPGLPPLGGILILGEGELGEEVKRVVDNIEVPVPVLRSKHRIHDMIRIINKMEVKIHGVKSPKVEVANRLFDAGVDKESIGELVGASQTFTMTPKLFQYKIYTAARSQKMHIVLPEGEDKRVVMAAAELASRDLCHITILGKPGEVKELAAKHQADVSSCEIIHPPDAPDYDELVAKLVELRGAKGMTEEKARELIASDYNWYGTMRMAVGTMDGMVSGACHTTANTIRPALQVIKTAPGFSLVSSVFFMLLPHQVFVYGDCAINVEPNAAQLAEIAATSAVTAKSFGIAPRVALLSYATGDSNKGAIIDKVREACAAAREMDQTGAPYEGPIQFDAAVDPEVAKVKFKGEENAVAGHATVCVFPDLNAGNNAYKAVQQASGCIAMGPIMQGLKKPVNDLSRGCTVDDIVNTVVITCIQAQAVVGQAL